MKQHWGFFCTPGLIWYSHSCPFKRTQPPPSSNGTLERAIKLSFYTTVETILERRSQYLLFDLSSFTNLSLLSLKTKCVLRSPFINEIFDGLARGQLASRLSFNTTSSKELYYFRSNISSINLFSLNSCLKSFTIWSTSSRDVNSVSDIFF